MAVSKEYVAFVLEQLAGVGVLSSRPMFGAVSIYGDGTIFAMVHDDQLYLKVGPHNLADFEASDSEPFRPYGDERTMAYWTVPPDVLEDREALVAWSKKALDGAQNASRAKTRRKR